MDSNNVSNTKGQYTNKDYGLLPTIYESYTRHIDYFKQSKNIELKKNYFELYKDTFDKYGECCIKGMLPFLDNSVVLKWLSNITKMANEFASQDIVDVINKLATDDNKLLDAKFHINDLRNELSMPICISYNGYINFKDVLTFSSSVLYKTAINILNVIRNTLNEYIRLQDTKAGNDNQYKYTTEYLIDVLIKSFNEEVLCIYNFWRCKFDSHAERTCKIKVNPSCKYEILYGNIYDSFCVLQKITEQLEKDILEQNQ